jgi:hypothetical protein
VGAGDQCTSPGVQRHANTKRNSYPEGRNDKTGRMNMIAKDYDSDEPCLRAFTTNHSTGLIVRYARTFPGYLRRYLSQSPRTSVGIGRLLSGWQPQAQLGDGRLIHLAWVAKDRLSLEPSPSPADLRLPPRYPNVPRTACGPSAGAHKRAPSQKEKRPARKIFFIPCRTRTYLTSAGARNTNFSTQT